MTWKLDFELELRAGPMAREEETQKLWLQTQKQYYQDQPNEVTLKCIVTFIKFYINWLNPKYSSYCPLDKT